MTALKRCEAQAAPHYVSSPDSLQESLPCEQGALRVGVFFDGTGNDMQEHDTFSNVARLARVYRIEKENRTIRWIYTRGVGTNSRVDAFGSAFGKGGQERIFGALHCLQRLIEEFREASESYPTTILMDVFGFSRGAALARHFVNVVKQGAFNLDAKYRQIPKSAYRIGFLGAFDTVSSFGLPGNDVDLGYAFHIHPHWLQSGGLHLIADDEHRANFSLQAMLPAQDTAHPRDMADGSLQEVVMPGSHSDIGGGYSSEKTQGQSNNDLARVALEYMYARARDQNVPLDISNAPDRKEQETDRFWAAEDAMKSAHDTLMEHYRATPDLRTLHRRWRVLGISEEKLSSDVRSREKELAGPERPNSNQRKIQLYRMNEAIGKITSMRRNLEGQMENCFTSKRGYERFQIDSKALYDSWVHRSHSPHNTTIGMTPGIHGLEGRRAVFHPPNVALMEISGATRAAARAFKKGAWIDEECLELHP